MGKLDTITMTPGNGVPKDTAIRLTQDFLRRHGSGLDDLLRRFPSMRGPALRKAIEARCTSSETTLELALVLDEAVDTLLSLQEEDCKLLPVDDGRRFQIDVGLRRYAVRLHDLSNAA